MKIAILGLLCLIAFAIYANVYLYGMKKNGSFTSEDEERLEEQMKIW